MKSLVADFRGVVFVFLSALLFGSYGIWAVLLGSDFGVFFQGYVRSGLVLLVLLPAAFLLKLWQPMRVSDWRYFLWCAGFGIFTQVPLYYAFQHAGVGISSLIFFAVSLITAYVVGASLLSEKLGRLKIASLFLALVGLAVTFSGSLGTFALLALLAAAANGVASGGEVSTTKLVPGRFPALQTSIIIWGAIFLTHLPLSLLAGETQVVPAITVPWLAMLAFAGAGLLAFWLVVEGYKYVDASIGGLVGLLEIVFAIIFGYLVFSESVTTPMILGSAIIIAAAALPHVPRIASGNKETVLPHAVE